MRSDLDGDRLSGGRPALDLISRQSTLSGHSRTNRLKCPQPPIAAIQDMGQLLPMMSLVSLLTLVAALGQIVDDPLEGSTPVNQAAGGSALKDLCSLTAGDPTMKLTSQRLTLRINIYAPVELVGPSECLRVKLYLSDRDAGRQLARLMAEKEDAKKYEFLADVIIDGDAAYDQGDGNIRLNVTRMTGFSRAER